jgi:hypothetical protein
MSTVRNEYTSHATQFAHIATIGSGLRLCSGSSISEQAGVKQQPSLQQQQQQWCPTATAYHTSCKQMLLAAK